MADDNATLWGGNIRLGRAPANNEVLVGNAAGGFTLTPSSSIGGNIQTMLDGISSTQGSILYRGASAWTALTPGTSGYLLQTNGAGANPSWVAPTASSVWSDVVKSADQSVTSSTTVVNVTDMAFSAAANTYYSFQIVLLYVVPISTGLNIAITFPASPTALMYSIDTYDPSNNGSGSGQFVGTTTSGGVLAISLLPSSGTLSINGYLNNGANSGTVQLQFAQKTSSATAATIRKGSWMRYRTV